MKLELREVQYFTQSHTVNLWQKECLNPDLSFCCAVQPFWTQRPVSLSFLSQQDCVTGGNSGWRSENPTDGACHQSFLHWVLRACFCFSSVQHWVKVPGEAFVPAWNTRVSSPGAVWQRNVAAEGQKLLLGGLNMSTFLGGFLIHRLDNVGVVCW